MLNVHDCVLRVGFEFNKLFEFAVHTKSLEPNSYLKQCWLDENHLIVQIVCDCILILFGSKKKVLQIITAL